MNWERTILVLRLVFEHKLLYIPLKKWKSDKNIVAALLSVVIGKGCNINVRTLLRYSLILTHCDMTQHKYDVRLHCEFRG
jgi:hypothetical protein